LARLRAANRYPLGLKRAGRDSVDCESLQ